jgi:Fe-S cluster biosynthesis and repair protein YggX/predicted TPR repeat methyltransferase
MDTEAVQRRIAQFETMVRPEADPTNDMAWFSLGGAYKDAGRFLDSAHAYRKVVELNPAFSKAWQMLGQMLIDAGKAPEAVAALTEGYTQAAQRGDRMPQKAMGELLAKLGAPLPEVQSARADAAAGTSTGDFICKRTGKPGHKLEKPPLRGAFGAWVFENISKETWEDWIRQGTKVINELRLDFSRDEDAEKYDAYMKEYLGYEG